MSIIEQATKRLEALQRAGVALPAGIEDVRTRPDPVPLRPVSDIEGLLRETDRAERRRAEARHPLQQVELDLARLERSGHVVPADSRTAVAQAFRGIKRPLLKNAAARATNPRLPLIMVSSALPGEGKTFCAINLALSLAVEIQTSVLLVDADVIRPDLMGRLGVRATRGLLDLLTDPGLDLSDVLLQTNVPNLALLPAGTPSTRATELLASPVMERVLDALAGRYGIVVFDAPPLLVTTEATVLASRVGQVLLVVEAARTPRSAVERAFQALQECPIVASLLNKGSEPKQHEGYGYYYG